MHHDPALYHRLLCGEATAAEWQQLEESLTADPAAARQWAREASLHAALCPPCAPLQRRSADRTVRIGILGGLTIAAAACVAALLPGPRAASESQPLPARVVKQDVTQPPLPARETGPAVEPGPGEYKSEPAEHAAEQMPLIVSSVRTADRVVALRFSDGPGAHTLRLLDLLKAEGVKATFFCTGSNVQRYPEVVRRMAAEGHEIGNHTWTHPNLARLPEERVRDEIRRTQEAIVKITGRAPVVFKPPYGAVSAVQAEFLRREFGLTTTLWSVDPQDWKHRDAARTEAAVLAAVKPGAFVILHDIHSQTVDAVPGILRRLKAENWKFMTVTGLMQHGTPVAAQGAAADEKN